MSGPEGLKEPVGTDIQFDIDPIISSIEDVLKRQLSANLSGIQQKYGRYLDAYRSIKSLPFILELTEANDRLRRELTESQAARDALSRKKSEIEEQVRRLEDQMTSANKLVGVLADRLMNLEPNNVYLEIAKVLPELRSPSETDDLISRLYTDLGIDEGSEDGSEDEHECGDNMDVCSKDLKRILADFGSQCDANRTGADQEAEEDVVVEELAEEEDEEEEQEEQEEEEEEDEVEEEEDEVEEVEEELVAEEEEDEEEEDEEEEELEEVHEERAHEEEEVDDDEVEDDEVEDGNEVKEESNEKAEEDQVEEEDDDDDEVFEVVIKGKKYFASSVSNGLIYQFIDEDTMGEQVGIYKNSRAIFN